MAAVFTAFSSIHTAAPRSAARARLVLAACVIACCLAAMLVAQGMPRVPREADLARLLRGMALIKGAMAVAGFALVWWRLGFALPRSVAGLYGASVCLASATSVLIWQLQLVAPALAFHLGELLFLVALWRDHRSAAAKPGA